MSPPHRACGGVLGPWGDARVGIRRVTATRLVSHNPRRGRCRRCRRTEVLLHVAGYPRRPDSAEPIGVALLAAAGGAGHRSIARDLEFPATTVRGWLRRARVNAEPARLAASLAAHDLDPMCRPIPPTGSFLGDMVEAVGRAVQAAVLRLGPGPPWQVAVLCTGCPHPGATDTTQRLTEPPRPVQTPPQTSRRDR